MHHKEAYLPGQELFFLFLAFASVAELFSWFERSPLFSRSSHVLNYHPQNKVAKRRKLASIKFSPTPSVWFEANKCLLPCYNTPMRICLEGVARTEIFSYSSGAGSWLWHFFELLLSLRWLIVEQIGSPHLQYLYLLRGGWATPIYELSTRETFCSVTLIITESMRSCENEPS